MSLFDRIVSKLRDIVHSIAGDVHEAAADVKERVEEVREDIKERRAASLAEKLDELAANQPYKNWRESIEDVAYLVGEDGSFKGRTALWSDLGFTGEYKGTAEQNIELHARFIERLPSHGIPWPKQ